MSKIENVTYKASVNTPAGWRYVVMSGTAERISPKRVKVIEITEIDGEPVSRNMSRTGANRQRFNGVYFASAEVGKVKNIAVQS